jgi:serine/threonine-protein kinase
MSTPPLDDLGQRLQGGIAERFTLRHEIGRGGMSVVYLARETHPDREVAIKVLDPLLTVGLGRERFIREINFVSQLTHPHIVPIFAAGEAAGLLYFVMPYVTGESLADIIQREGRLPPRRALRWAAEVALALEFAHKHDIVHRDIKPHNILLQDDLALVADFGVARAVRAARTEPITSDGLTLGTPAYMSPEQVGGSADVDARSDIYALGCVLYHMLAGEAPFGEGPWDVTMQRQVSTAPQPLAVRIPGVSQAVDETVRRALAKSPTDRFATARAFAARLDELRSALTTGESIGLRETLASRWIRIATAGALLGVVAIVAILVVGRSSPLPPSAFEASTSTYAESLAVMLVDNQTALSSLDGVADAITHEVIAALHRVPDLKIPSYISVHRLSSERATPGAIAEQLGVRLVLASQFREMGDTLWLDAELVDGMADRVLAGDSWPVVSASAGEFVGSFVQRLVEMVRAGAQLDRRPERVTALEGPAYDTYLIGRHWLGRRTPQGVRRAIASFQEAIDSDSTYVPAYEGLSTSYMLALFYRYEIGLDGYDVAARALTAANRAVALDRLYARAYGARGYVISRAYGPTRRAAADFGRAIELAPNDGQALAWAGMVRWWEGEAEQALAMILRGADLDPLSPAANLSVAITALPLGELDVAIDRARRATALEPELFESRAVEGRALLLAGRAGECLDIEFGPHEAIRALCLSAVDPVAAAAHIDSIADLLERGDIVDTLYTDVMRADGLAGYYAWTGDNDEALRWLEYAFERSPIGVDRRVLESRLFDGLRRDPGAAARLEALTRGIWPRVERGAQEQVF